MIAALYARVSTVRQAEKDLSIPDQLKQMREWCKRNGHTVAIEYVEAGASATDSRRPVFQQMMNEACLNPAPFGVVVVHSLSRFFRDAIEFGIHERRLKRYCVQVVSITQQTTDDPAGEMARKIFNVFDEYQSRENGKHTLRAMKENARQGFFNGSNPPYGYRLVEVPIKGRRGNKKRIEIDPSESRIVIQIFKLYECGPEGAPLGLKGVAYHLNELGVTKRGRKWSKTDIDVVLKNRVYIGEYFFNKKEAKTGRVKPESEWIKLQIEPIVSKETFARVADLKKMRSPSVIPPRVVNSPTLLTGLLKCGICGASMTLATGKGGRYRYYKCANRINQGLHSCCNGNVRMEQLDDAVLTTVSQKVFVPARVEQIVRKIISKIQTGRSDHEQKVKTLDKSLKKAEKALERLYEAVESGLLPIDDTLKERAQRHKARREELLIELARLNRPEASMLPRTVNRDQINAFCGILRERFADGSSKFGKEYLRLLVDQITVADRQVVITGKNAAILQAIERTKPDILGKVPGFVGNWLPSTDSNRGLGG